MGPISGPRLLTEHPRRNVVDLNAPKVRIPLSAISYSGDTLMRETLSKKQISGGVVHDLPADLKKALTSNAKALETWEDITSLARNEWICWIESAKKAETRTRRIEWGCSSLKDGKRRPCCWPGCPHR